MFPVHYCPDCDCWPCQCTTPEEDEMPNDDAHPPLEPVPDHALTHALRGAAVSQHGALTVVDYRKATTPPLGELLPCPFCGGTEGAFGTDSLDMEWESQGTSRNSVLFWWVACDCGARGPSVEASSDGARDAWNRRATATETPKPGPTYPVRFFPSRAGGRKAHDEAELLRMAAECGTGWLEEGICGKMWSVVASYAVVPHEAP